MTLFVCKPIDSSRCFPHPTKMSIQCEKVRKWVSKRSKLNPNNFLVQPQCTSVSLRPANVIIGEKWIWKRHVRQGRRIPCGHFNLKVRRGLIVLIVQQPAPAQSMHLSKSVIPVTSQNLSTMLRVHHRCTYLCKTASRVLAFICRWGGISSTIETRLAISSPLL